MMASSFPSKPLVCFEVEKVIGVAFDGTCRRYQVQWAPVWLSSFHLVGCERLIQEFLMEKGHSEIIRQNSAEKCVDSLGKMVNASSDILFLEGQPNAVDTDSDRISGATVIHEFGHLDEHAEANQRNDNQEHTDSGDHLGDKLDDQSSAVLLTIVKIEKEEGRDGDPGDPLDETDNDLNQLRITSETVDVKAEDDYIATSNTEIKSSLTNEGAEYHKDNHPQENDSIFSSPENRVTNPLRTACYSSPDGTTNQFGTDSEMVLPNCAGIGETKFPMDSSLSSCEFSCHICAKTFSSKYLLEMHFRSHSGERPYTCSYCGKAFSQNGNLNRHIQTHMGVRPYECEVCAKTFARRSHLKDHKMIHSGVKPFQCEMCDKAYFRKNHLKDHLKTHLY